MVPGVKIVVLYGCGHDANDKAVNGLHLVSQGVWGYIWEMELQKLKGYLITKYNMNFKTWNGQV